MTTEQHEILYNIGMRLSCENMAKMHLCPRERGYRYFVYWTKILEKKGYIFGSAIDQNIVQLKRKTGEEIVSLETTPQFCPNVSNDDKRVKMIWKCSCNKIQCDDMVKALGDLLMLSIRNVAIEKTLVLKENESDWHMPMIDFIDVFDEGALLTHFRSLFKCFLEETILENDGEGMEVINRIKNLLQNWEWIYDRKNDVLNQVENYMNLAMEGIEGMDSAPGDLVYLSGGIRDELKKKKNTEDVLSFLLQKDFNRECFRECVTILMAFLKKYVKNDVKDLLQSLQKYENKELQIHKIKKLQKIDLTSSKAKIANARLIEAYLADRVKYSCGMMFECIAS